MATLRITLSFFSLSDFPFGRVDDYGAISSDIATAIICNRNLVCLLIILIFAYSSLFQLHLSFFCSFVCGCSLFPDSRNIFKPILKHVLILYSLHVTALAASSSPYLSCQMSKHPSHAGSWPPPSTDTPNAATRGWVTNTCGPHCGGRDAAGFDA